MGRGGVARGRVEALYRSRRGAEAVAMGRGEAGRRRGEAPLAINGDRVGREIVAAVARGRGSEWH